MKTATIKMEPIIGRIKMQIIDGDIRLESYLTITNKRRRQHYCSVVVNTSISKNQHKSCRAFCTFAVNFIKDELQYLNLLSQPNQIYNVNIV